MVTSRRAGFSLIELLVVVAIIAILIALLLPATQRVREAAGRTQCINNLKQMGIGLHAYHDIHRRFPPALAQDFYQSALPGIPPRPPVPPGATPWFSWMARILPFVEQDNLYKQINFNGPAWFQHPLNETRLSIYMCPGDDRSYLLDDYGGDLVALTEYLAVNGTDQLSLNGILYVNSMTRMTSVTDGLSNTFMVGERPPSSDLVYGWWFAGSGDYPYYGATDVDLGVNELIGRSDADFQKNNRDTYHPGEINDPDNIHRWHFWSLHPGGGNFLMGDGSCRFVLYGVGQDVMDAIATRAGNEPVILP
jgi:prepilin-type N-terminal cleavage/methylation domain-containing protein/prepilin-type processing-associated H-X9-DG protein